MLLEAQAEKLIDRIKELEKENEWLHKVMLDAINILDGNKEPINWREGGPELLRKLCEHLEAIREQEDE